MEQFIEKYKQLLGKMSYYNASERNYFSETESRDLLRDQLKNMGQYLEAQGVNVDEIASGYLVSTRDYK